MSWLRTDDGFTSHPKFSGWKPAQKWAFLELMHYAARYRTEGVIPDDLALLPRGVDGPLLKLAESSGWIERDDQNRMVIHDFHLYNPKDVTAASRMKAYRERNADRNNDRNFHSNETVSRAQARAVPVPSLRTTTSLSQDLERTSERERSNDEEDRRQAWLERSAKPDVRSPQAFVAAGIRSGAWPDPYVAAENGKARATENGSGHGPAYIAGLIRNGVIADLADLETELTLAGVEDEDRSSLLAQLQLAQQLEGRE